jgi:hypothetical protein
LWVVVTTPGGVHCYQVDEGAAAGRLAAVRAELGVPETLADGWDVQLVTGEPHQKLLSRAAKVRRTGRPTAPPGAVVETTAGPDGPRPLLPHEVLGRQTLDKARRRRP